MVGPLTNITGGTPPRNFAHPAAPEPLEAVAGEPALKGGNLVQNREIGTPHARPVVIMIGDRNLTDIITELQTLLP